MKLTVYSIFDRVAGNYMTPFFLQSDAVAVRAFTHVVRDPNSDISKAPGDYDLVEVGVWDDYEGMFEPRDGRIVARAAQVVKVQEVV